ncbi:alpha-glucosidase/alpha-galactosidase [Kribbella sindirgiensis]|uniref:Alpha-glucosidase/alpha-galactosidase n=1 Tax=Kribbella sindirgiensis TaxID=1124744 RepID=A0A4R0IPB7_9ACTN|nr:alpha-glucosidase/alpha-galactosidase [Kribbella sindirgiensis]TCC34787.1 alpha-glucosidase/alpha-galactosidase [Kribbella sindirgiensis]
MTRIAFIGAGSVVFTQGLLADLFALELGPLQIALHDIDPERLETAAAAAAYIARERGVVPQISTHLERRAALDGADFVINIVQVGMNAATHADFEIPARYGIRQTIGDTLGVGGVFRALRTFPVLRGLAQDIADMCPDAWLLNYTNPMVMNVWYLKALGVRNVVGLCHSVYWTMQGLSELVGVPYDDVTYLAAGVNHQSWVLRFERGSENLYDRLDEAIAADPELLRRVRVDMYRRLGFYPTETSEHSAEYVPWYLGHAREVERLRLPIGAYLDIVAENLASYEHTRNALKTGDPVEVEPTMEYAPQIIHSIVTGTPRTVYGNVPNTGLIPNLQPGAVVEVPCLVDASGVRPTAVGALPAQCAALNRAYLSVAELAVQAAIEEDPRAIRQAVMVDPATAAALPVEQIWELCNDLVLAHRNYLDPSLRAALR